jgi:hypothetical protein
MSKDLYAIFRAPVNSLILSKLSVLRRVRSRHLFTFKGRSFIRPKRKMQLTYVAVVVLASMIFVLSGMVGYVYWQQTRLIQNLQSLAVVVSTHFIRPPQPQPELEPEHVAEPEQESELPQLVPVDEKLASVKEDDRVSVNEVEVVEGPPAAAPVPADALVDFEKKTANELKELLTQKGIPFGKRDAKSVLVQLLKATA